MMVGYLDSWRDAGLDSAMFSSDSPQGARSAAHRARLDELSGLVYATEREALIVRS